MYQNSSQLSKSFPFVILDSSATQSQLGPIDGTEVRYRYAVSVPFHIPRTALGTAFTPVYAVEDANSLTCYATLLGLPSISVLLLFPQNSTSQIPSLDGHVQLGYSQFIRGLYC